MELPPSSLFLPLSLPRENYPRSARWSSEGLEEEEASHLISSAQDDKSSRGAEPGSGPAPRRRRRNNSDNDEIANALDLSRRAPNVQ